MSIAIRDPARGLVRPSAYAHPVTDVRCIETHISIVLLAGDFAYKIKKPVSLGFLDYSTIEARKHMCEEEIRLNRRLAPGIYLGVERITDDGHALRVGGEGETVDYAVKMRRVTEDRLLSARIAHDDVSRDDVHAVARVLGAFHRSAATDAKIAAHGRSDTIRWNWSENFEQTHDCVGYTLSADARSRMETFVDRWLSDHGDLIEQRADGGRVRDIHGDLRCDSVVIDPAREISIMDCIEFSDRLRCGDVAGDVAFLAMDMEFRDRRDLVDEFMAAYLGETGDGTLAPVLDFYRCYRAYVRGKVEWLTRSGTRNPSERSAADGRGSRYFQLAESYASAMHPPRVVAMAGLSGTGKSFVANALAARLGAAVLSTDGLRRAALGLPAGADLRSEPNAGRYTGEERARVYASMRDQAGQHLRAGIPVILDATHAAAAERAETIALASGAGVPLLFVRVTADEATVRARLAARGAGDAHASDADWAVYAEQLRQFEPLDECGPGLHMEIDGAAALTSNLDAIVARLGDAPVRA